MPSSPPSEGPSLSSTPTAAADLPPSTQPATAPPDSSAIVRHMMISLCAGAMLVSFFLPWVTFLGAKLSGLDIAKHFSSYQLVCLMPILAGIVLLLSLARVNSRLIQALAGLCPLIILVYAINQFSADLFQILEFGAWMVMISGVLLTVALGETKPSKAA